MRLELMRRRRRQHIASYQNPWKGAHSGRWRSDLQASPRMGQLIPPIHPRIKNLSMGLLTNDALLAAVGRRLRVLALASTDRQFSRVPGLILYAPDDLEEKTH